MPEIPDKRVAQARYAAAVRWAKPDRDDKARELAEARIADYVVRVVATAPPLQADQRDRIAALLRLDGLTGGAR